MLTAVHPTAAGECVGSTYRVNMTIAVVPQMLNWVQVWGIRGLGYFVMACAVSPLCLLLSFIALKSNTNQRHQNNVQHRIVSTANCRNSCVQVRSGHNSVLQIIGLLEIGLQKQTTCVRFKPLVLLPAAEV